MASWTDNLVPSLSGLGMWTVIIIVLGILIMGGVAFWVWFIWHKRRWYLTVYFKLIRENGKSIIRETGKGRYDFKEGVLWIKRPKKTPEGLKIQKLDKYLSGDNSVEVIGNPDNWMLVVPESYTEVTDEETGKIAMFANIKADTKEDRAWAVQAERSWKNAFSVQNLLYEYKDYIGWGLVIFICILANFVGFSYLAGKIK
jgi:hypothetical protein